MTLTFGQMDFRGQILKRTHLRNVKAGLYLTKRIGVIHDHNLGDHGEV